MTLDWTTFGLEILNFLVLVWLLKRFLYRPVLDRIERRRQEDARVVNEAEALRKEAQALKARYEERLAAAAADREHALAKLDAEMASERDRRLAAIGAEADAELVRRQELTDREAQAREAELARQAIGSAAAFAARLLERLAGPALEAQLVSVALEDLSALDEEGRGAVRDAMAQPGAVVEVATAFPLPDDRRRDLTTALAALAGRDCAPSFIEEPALLAGLRVRAGPWVLMANLQDELAFFASRAPRGD